MCLGVLCTLPFFVPKRISRTANHSHHDETAPIRPLLGLHFPGCRDLAGRFLAGSGP
jgi:hypothetical protein